MSFVGRIRLVMALAIVWALFPSCIGIEPDGDGKRSSVSFVLSAVPTRAAVESHESDLASIDLLVFRASDGGIDTYRRFTGSALSSFSVELPVGTPMHWHVVSNAPAGKLSGYLSEGDFLAGVTRFDESTSTSLVMHAGGNVTPSLSGNVSVSVDLERYACKVSIGSLRVSWLESSAGSGVTLEKVAIINAVGTCPLSGIPLASSLWYNKMDVDGTLSGVVADMLVRDFGSVPVTDSDSHDLGSVVYCYPNPTSNAVNSVTNPEWCARNTRVCLLLMIDGQPNWYSVNLPAMECNKHYRINSFTVNGPGTLTPDEPLVRVDMVATVTVTAWEDLDINADF